MELGTELLLISAGVLLGSLVALIWACLRVNKDEEETYNHVDDPYDIYNYDK